MLFFVALASAASVACCVAVSLARLGSFISGDFVDWGDMCFCFLVWLGSFLHFRRLSRLGLR